jgi:hypothetical protein
MGNWVSEPGLRSRLSLHSLTKDARHPHAPVPSLRPAESCQIIAVGYQVNFVTGVTLTALSQLSLGAENLGRREFAQNYLQLFRIKGFR